MKRTPISNPFDEDERQGRQPVFWSILGLGILCIGSLFTSILFFYKPDPQAIIGQLFPSATGTATRTSTPTATPSPTPTMTLTATPDLFLTSVSEMNPAYIDDFSSNKYHWEPFFGSNRVQIIDGLLSLRSTRAGYVGIATCTSCLRAGNSFYFQGDVFLQEDKHESFGLAFCIEDSDSFYTFSINTKVRRFTFSKHSSKGWETLVRNRSAPVIARYPNINTLGIHFDRGEIILYINKISVYSFTDEKPYRCSRFGFFVDGGEFDMLADNVEVYKVQAIPSPTP